jgi:hypothetical protein
MDDVFCIEKPFSFGSPAIFLKR